MHGLSAYPPYPEGYGWPSLMYPHRYWNGDVWPMAGCRYASALFGIGYPDLAQTVLRNVARAVIRDQGFSEYHEADAEAGKLGAFQYGFSAAPFQRAVVEGLFGLEPDCPHHALDIRPSVRHSGCIECRLGMYEVAMDVAVDQNRIALALDTDFRGLALFRVLLPNCGATWSAATDGRRIPSSISTTGQAAYLSFEDLVCEQSSSYVIAAVGQR